jgi:hypothetical protein
MSVKTEIMSLRLVDEMIFSLHVRSRANCVGFYMIPYIRAHIFGNALLTPESIIPRHQKESHRILDHFVHDGHWMESMFTSYPYDLISLIPIRQ